MINAQKAQANDADRVAMVALQDYFALVSTSNRDPKEQKAYEACKGASHSVLEREGETTLRMIDPCFTAAQQLQPAGR